MKLPVRLLAAALALAAFAAPGVAGAVTRHHARSHHAGHDGGDPHTPRPSYPMKADEFRALMEKRIDAVRATIDRKLDRRGVSADRKKAIHRVFDEASKDLRAEIDRAAADGTVTQGEADRAKTLAAGLRGKVRERLRAEKDPRALAKLAKEEASKKEASKKEKATRKASHDGGGEPATKTAKAEPSRDASKAKTKTRHDGGSRRPSPDYDGGSRPQTPGAKKHAGMTKQAKASPGKKHKQPEGDPGANL